jgi:hypothetical protein
VKVLALIYGDEARWEAASEEDRNTMLARYVAFGEAANGNIVDGAQLAPTRTATTVRVRNGEAIVTDGPFAETKEQLGGFYLFEVESLGEAAALAAQIPGAASGAVELRAGHDGGVAMKYLMLLNNDAASIESWHELSQEEARKLREQEVPRWNELFGWISEQSIDLDGLELEEAAKARVVRVRDGETLVSDGPFAETKEVTGGYFLADCEDLDQAIELAQRVPLVGKGSVEIRPLARQ